MTETLIGYARCFTDAQDLTASSASPRTGIYLDHGLTGTTRNRPGLGQALADPPVTYGSPMLCR